MATQILTWWLVVQALGLAGLPLTCVLFRALPDRGYAFGKALGLLLAGYLAWLVAMLGLAPFGPALIVLSALAVGGVGLFAVRRQTPDSARGSRSTPASLGITATPAQPSLPLFAIRDSLLSWLRGNWRMVLGYEALFVVALVFLALLRSYVPNPWGTERPMDYALFNAIRRSATFPPHDPWLSGYSINYYYFGYLLMAAVALISGLDPAVAYNLSLALIFALTALGVAGLCANLIALATNDERRTTDDERRTSPQSKIQNPKSKIRMTNDEAQAGKSEGRDTQYATRSRGFARIFAITLAVILVLFAANQGGALQVITGTNMAVALDGRNLARAIVNGLGPRQPLYFDSPFKGDYFDGTRVITPTDTIKDFNWWNSSRAVWDDYTQRGDPSKHYAITEFPFFSFWLGDMHPHVMALPFGLLALALALQTLVRPAAPNFALGRRGWLELALTGIILGSLYVINSWDFPTYLLVFLGALLILYVRLGRDQRSASPTPDSRPATPTIWWQHYARQAAMALLAALILFTPFYLTFHSLVGGRGFPLGLVTWSKTPLYSFLIIFGLFLLPLLVYVIMQGRRRVLPRAIGQDTADEERPGMPAQGETADRDRESRARRPGSGSQGIVSEARSYLSRVTLIILVLGPLIGFPLLVLLPLALYASLLAVEQADHPATAFVLWAFAVGCLICFGTEVVYIRDVFDSRLNTIFKFYYQAWLIWGVLAGYALWWVYTRAFSARRPGGYVFSVLFVLLLGGALVYPWLTAGQSFREGQRVGLAGKTPRDQTPDGAAAIAWLRANAPGDAAILEAVGDAYDVTNQGFGGVSASTGLATVLGWPGHEHQWRGGDPGALAQIEPRKADVETIYNTTDVGRARELLAKYKVDYIYVGAAERAAYRPEGLAKLAQLGTPAFQQGEVVVYRVK